MVRREGGVKLSSRKSIISHHSTSQRGALGPRGARLPPARGRRVGVVPVPGVGPGHGGIRRRGGTAGARAQPTVGRGREASVGHEDRFAVLECWIVGCGTAGHIVGRVGGAHGGGEGTRPVLVMVVVVVVVGVVRRDGSGLRGRRPAAVTLSVVAVVGVRSSCGVRRSGRKRAATTVVVACDETLSSSVFEWMVVAIAVWSQRADGA
mmetsp:Transcript_13187/g.40977  ORF Transcript_13187/g.40977 Transcript_13187/m.40977 type:complete len:207 (+) Transcript_13187:544-1164(+)